jgi:uncharacterized membrane protein
MKMERLKKRCFPWRYIVFIAGIALCCVICFFYLGNLKSIQGESVSRPVIDNEGSAAAPIGELLSGQSVSQTFSVSNDGTYRLLIQVGTYNRTNTCSLVVTLLKADTGERISAVQLSADDLADNHYADLGQDFILAAGDYILTVESPDATPGNAVSLFASSDDTFTQDVFLINGQPQVGDLRFKLSALICLKTTELGVIVLFAGAAATLVLLYWALFVRKKRGVFIAFALAMAALGIFYGLVLPFPSAPDEPVHASTAYYYSNRLLGEPAAVKNTDESSLGWTWYTDTFRACDREYIAQAQIIGGVFGYKEYYTEIQVPPSTDLILAPEETYPYFPLGYLPGALGITIGRLLGMSAAVTFSLGRWLGFAVKLGLILFAVRRSKVFRLPMMVIALLPMTLELVSSYSLDGMLVALAFLIFSEVDRLMAGKKTLTWKSVLPLALICMLFTPVKIVYLPIAFCGFLIPSARFASKKQFWAAGLLVLLAGAGAALAWNAGSLSQTASGAVLSGQIGSEGYTVSYILSHPFEALSLVFGTLSHNISDYWTMMIGGKLGWLNITINSLLVYAFSLLLILSMFPSRERSFTIPRQTKAVSGGILLATVGLIFLSMMLWWTSFGSAMIDGIQGRYFLVLLPLVALFQLKWTAFERQDERLYLLGMVFLNFLALLQCYYLIAAL